MKRRRSPVRLVPHLISGVPQALSTVAASGSGFARADGLSSTARGYGADWRRVRAQVLSGEPLCRLCAEAGRVTAATDVDHIEPFQGLADPRRLAVANLRPLCRPCHMARTARQAAGTATPGGV